MGIGYRETQLISDGLHCLGNVNSTANRFTNTLFPQSSWDQKSPVVLIRNFYALYASVYDLDSNSNWPYTANIDYGMTYMGTHNDMHCGAAISTQAAVAQLDGDPNYYISTSTGSGFYLDCGTTAPDFFS